MIAIWSARERQLAGKAGAPGRFRLGLKRRRVGAAERPVEGGDTGRRGGEQRFGAGTRAATSPRSSAPSALPSIRSSQASAVSRRDAPA